MYHGCGFYGVSSRVSIQSSVSFSRQLFNPPLVVVPMPLDPRGLGNVVRKQLERRVNRSNRLQAVGCGPVRFAKRFVAPRTNERDEKMSTPVGFTTVTTTLDNSGV